MLSKLCCFFFFNDPATTEIYTLSLHDALPISSACASALKYTCAVLLIVRPNGDTTIPLGTFNVRVTRSEEHTSELQSQFHLVCRLLLEKKKTCGVRAFTRRSIRA